MFQNICEQNVVELLPVRKFERFDIGHLKRVVAGPGSFRGSSVALDSRDVMTSLPQNLAQITAGAPDVKNVDRLSFMLQRFQDPVVAAVLKILKFVSIPWHARATP